MPSINSGPSSSNTPNTVAVFNNQQMQSGIPFIMAPTGSMANNGVITLGTALPTTYANCYLFLPANAIQTGSLAGWYFAQMSSTTVGIVFLNSTYVSGMPSIPVTPVTPATTGPGAYTGVTTAQVGPQITIPTGLLGPNGVLRSSMLTNELNNANAKTLTLAIGAGTFVNTNLASVGSVLTTSAIFNQGSQAAQVSMPSASNIGLGTDSANLAHNTVNFANAQTYAISLTRAVATDYFILEGFLIEIFPG